MADITITEPAATRLKEILGQATEPQTGLRVYVEHRCHCGGLRYGMDLQSPGESDAEMDVAGVHVYVAPDVRAEKGEASIDFVRSPLQTGFTLTNSEHSCGGMHGH